MISKLDNNFSFFEASLRVLGQRQEILSSNVANESTPNFKAQDFDFRRAISDAVSASEQSRVSGDLNQKLPTFVSNVHLRKNIAGLDGNNVNIDEERREMALNAIKYESAVTLAQIDIKNLLSVLQG